jgi:hypothetical protein
VYCNLKEFAEKVKKAVNIRWFADTLLNIKMTFISIAMIAIFSDSCHRHAHVALEQ